jgi:hypothetical protein
MDLESERHHNNRNEDNNNIRSNAISASIPIAVVVVATALVLGSSSFVSSSYPQAMAQQNNTTPLAGTDSTSIGGKNATTIVVDVQSSVCAETQTGGTFDEGITVGGTSALDDDDVGSEGDNSAATIGTTNAASTTIAEIGGGNQSTLEVRDYLEEACIALQVGDSQGALMYLDLALNVLGGDGTQGNITSTPSGITNGTTTTGVGGGMTT